jgi:hypothetical protein
LPKIRALMITVLIMNVIFWVVNFKTQNYFVISTTQNASIPKQDSSDWEQNSGMNSMK